MEKKNLLKGTTAFLIVAIAIISMTGCYKKESGSGNAGSSDSGGNTATKTNVKEAPRTDFNYYLIEDGIYGTGIVIERYTGNGGDVVIPAEIEGYPVVYLDRFAFLGNSTWFAAGVDWTDGKTGAGNNITSVVIPASVKYIGAWCFKAINNIKSVTIKGTGVIISGDVFKDDINLEELNIPDGDNVLIPDTYPSGDKMTDCFGGCKKLSLKTRARLVAMGFAEP